MYTPVRTLMRPALRPQPPADRSALAALALLAAANPAIGEQLLHDPIGAADAHPHYPIQLGEWERGVLADIQRQATSVGEFLLRLADIAEGPPEA